MLPWAHVLASAVILGPLASSAGGVGSTGSVERSSAPAEQANREQASEALAEARKLAASQRYEAAIEAFERALALRPSPGLHYNIAVCHHRLMLAADPKSALYEQHRSAAVNAYNAYLKGDADAEDRYAVASTVTDLGGRPQILDEWRISPEGSSTAAPVLRDDDSLWPEGTPPDDTDDDDDDDAEPPAAPIEPTPAAAPRGRDKRPFPHGAFGLAFAADLHGFGDTRGNAEVTTAPVLGPVLWGRAYLGPRRAFGVGGELAWATQPDPGDRQHRLTTTQLNATASWRATRGAQGRVDLGVGVLLGLVVQSLRHRGPSTAACRVEDSGIVSSRGGVLAAVRLQAAFALDTAKRHQITLRTGPGIGSFSEGTLPNSCMPADPFEEYGLRSQPLLFRTDLGYAIRW